MTEAYKIQIHCKTHVESRDSNVVLFRLEAGVVGCEKDWETQYFLVRREGIKVEVKDLND